MNYPVAPLGRAAKRVHSGMLPEFYDSVVRVDPSPTTEEWYYSAINPENGSNSVVAIIEIVYDSALKDRVLSARRMDLTVI